MATLTRSPDSGFLMGVTVGSVATAFGYNGYGEVESVTSGALYSEGLQYDSAGRLTVIQEFVNGTPTQYTYTCDSVGRLTSATKDGTQTTSWTYDGNGNRLTENGVTSTFDAQDRLLTKGTTTYTWDALGGRKTKTEGGQTTQYTHDGLGALQSVTLPDSTQVTYEYDARQRRVAKRRNGALEARWDARIADVDLQAESRRVEPHLREDAFVERTGAAVEVGALAPDEIDLTDGERGGHDRCGRRLPAAGEGALDLFVRDEPSVGAVAMPAMAGAVALWRIARVERRAPARDHDRDRLLIHLQHRRGREPHGVQVDRVRAGRERSHRNVAAEHLGQRELERLDDVARGGLEFDEHAGPP